ncbi:hypothetical protein GCM10009525_47020 [Streptosporangium amethystogenes subsp. fukuiense]
MTAADHPCPVARQLHDQLSNTLSGPLQALAAYPASPRGRQSRVSPPDRLAPSPAPHSRTGTVEWNSIIVCRAGTKHMAVISAGACPAEITAQWLRSGRPVVRCR